MQRPDSRMTELESARGEGDSKPRMIVFRVVVMLVALWVLAMNLLALMELFVMWLPAETVAGMFEEESSFISLHRTHFMAIGVVGWAVVLSMTVQLRKPKRRVAPMLLLIAVAATGVIVYGLSGTPTEWLIEEIAMVAVPVVLVALLHPSRHRFFERPAFHRPMLGLAGLAALPWVVYVVENGWLQFVNAAGDPHAEMEHWATAALMGIVIATAAFLGSSDRSGWRLTGWIAAGGSVIFGSHSLVFPGLASALPAFWAVAAVLWGAVFAAALVRRSRKDRPGSR